MKQLHTLIVILVFSALFACPLQATEDPISKTKVTSLQAIDSSKTQETPQEMIVILAEKQRTLETRSYLLISLTLFLVLLFGILCAFKKRSNKRLEKIIALLEKNNQKSTNDNNMNNETSVEIDEAIVAEILENLRAFEIERGFLTSKITLHAFAKQMQTNTKYLSKVINTYKMKSFRNYINDLRIQYSLKKLQSNPNYRKYTVNALATEAGFSTKQSFTKAFQRKTGKTVSSYLEQLN